MNCWRGLSLFAATIITKLHFCEFWLAPPLHSPPHQGTFESSINEADSLTNDLLSHKILEKCFSEVFIQKWLIGDTAKRSSRYLPGYCQFLDWMWASDDAVNHVKSVIVVWLPQIWFLCLGKFIPSEKKNVWAFCCRWLCSITVPPVASYPRDTIANPFGPVCKW